MGHCYFKTDFVVFSAELSLPSPGLTRMARVFQFFWDNLLDRVKRMIHWRNKGGERFFCQHKRDPYSLVKKASDRPFST